MTREERLKYLSEAYHKWVRGAQENWPREYRIPMVCKEDSDKPIIRALAKEVYPEMDYSLRSLEDMRRDSLRMILEMTD